MLFLVFRQTERWLQQHIFKVGWLLSNDIQITTVIYLIIFLPGIVLREVSLWLAAGVLNVRAARAIQFPDLQDIGELQLNFIRLETDTSRLKLFVIRFCPLAIGLVALWALATYVFQWEALTSLARAGSVDAVGAAINALMRTPDVLLWFYLTFVITNTMFRSLGSRTSRREKMTVLVMLPFLLFIIRQLGGDGNISVVNQIDGLMRGIALVIGQIMLVNLAAVLILGTLEALIEGLTNRSATFRDGKLITLSRTEARQLKLKQAQERKAQRESQANHRKAAAPDSIYDLHLPIPGPPGREPVSRQAVAVLNLDTAERALIPTDDATAAAARGRKPSRPLDSGAAEEPIPLIVVDGAEREHAADVSALQAPDDFETESPYSAPSGGENAPFNRPFVEEDALGTRPEAWEEDEQAAGEEPFARPFVMPTRSDPEGTGAGSETERNDALSNPEQERAQTRSREAQPRKSRTRPAPKPSKRTPNTAGKAEITAHDELEYEALDDADSIGNDEYYDDAL